MVALNGYIVAALALFAASLTEAAAVPRSAPWSSSLSTKVLIKRGTKQEQVIEKPNFYALSGGPGSVKYAVPPPPVEEPRPHTNQRAEFQHASVAQPIEWHADRTPSALYGSSHEPARHETQEVVGGGLRGGYGHSDGAYVPYYPPERPWMHHQYGGHQNLVVTVRPIMLQSGGKYLAARPVAASGLGYATGYGIGGNTRSMASQAGYAIGGKTN